jgi:DNA-binding CsgD family transcriptional regulator
MSEPISIEWINLKIAQVTSLADDISGMMMVHDLRDGSLLYVSPRGLEFLGISMGEIKGMSLEEYYGRFLNPADAIDFAPKLLNLVQNNNDEILTLFHRIRHAESNEWVWHMSSMKIITRDTSEKPVLGLTISFRLDKVPEVTAKANRVLEETAFLREHQEDFAKLGKREEEILKLLALGKSSAEIANELCISTATADTHRKNIKHKLNTNSFYELCQYARAFDLI